MWSTCTDCLVVLPWPFKSNHFTDVRFFNTFFFLNEIPFCFSLGLSKEIQIILISVGVLIVVAVVCLLLCNFLCPCCLPVCCVQRLGQPLWKRLCELFRCCRGDQRKINQTQTELQAKEQKEKCVYKYPIPVCSGSSVNSPNTTKGYNKSFMV